jgi:hypothetical protein
VADWYAGLQVIDVANPTAPQIVGSVNLPYPVNVVVVDDFAYVACVYWGLHVVDIANPTSPYLVDSVDAPFMAHDIAVSGDYLYVVSADAYGLVYAMGIGLCVFDIVNPASPQMVGSVDTPGIPLGVAVSGDFAYVAGGYGGSGLQIAPAQCQEALNVAIDIKPGSDSNPINCRANNAVIPVAILTTDTFDATTVDHTTVRFGPEGAAETHSNPHGPIRHEEDVDDDGDTDLLFHFRFGETGIQCGDTEATLTGLTYDGAEFSGTDQIRTVPGHATDDPELTRVRIVPNPFNPMTTVSFDIPRQERLVVAVYDLGGRRLKVLADGVHPPGRHDVTWNGQDARGRAMPSGTYIVRLDSESGVEARKVMLIR